MAQERKLEYLHDDDTWSLNERFMGILGAGRYRGFEAAPFEANMNLTLNHESTGYTRVNQDSSETENIGVLLSTQGVIIKETESIELSISPNNESTDRIDLIVCEHQKIGVTGGQPAIYSVIQGGAAPVPPVPNLQNPNQFIVGRIRIPSSTSQLSNSDAVYTPEPVPFLADDSSIWDALLELNSTFMEALNTLFLDDLIDVVINSETVANNHIVYRAGNLWRNRSLPDWITQTIWKMERRFELNVDRRPTSLYYTTTSAILNTVEFEDASTPAEVFSLDESGGLEANCIHLHINNGEDVPIAISTFQTTAQSGTSWELVFADHSVIDDLDPDRQRFNLLCNAPTSVLGTEGLPIKVPGVTGESEVFTPEIDRAYKITKWPDAFRVTEA